MAHQIHIFFKSVLLTTVCSFSVAAQSLGLDDYLEKVRTQNPQALALAKKKESFKARMDEGDLLTTPEFFADYSVLDNRKPPLMPGFQPSRTKIEEYNVGFRSQFAFGMSSSLSFGRSAQTLEGMNTGLFSLENPYTDTVAKLEFKQPLWRGGFGEKVRAQRDQISLAMQAQYASTSYELRQILIEAENTYWALSSFNEIVELQKNNVENAQRTNSWMQRRVRQRLYDDVEGLQTQAALEARQLEYESSLDEKRALERNLRKFVNGEVAADSLEPISKYNINTPANLQALAHDGAFKAQKLMQKSEVAKAKFSRSDLRPQLDLVASLAAHGKAPEFAQSVNEIDNGTQNTWLVGVEFSVPLDFSFLNRVRNGYDRQLQATQENLQAIEYDTLKTKEDLLAQARDAKARMQRAKDLERISEQIVKKERARHRNGRTTTFQMLKSEQDLAAAQIQRVRTQLTFIQLNNTLRLFSEEL